jgi:hypothetical protein
MSEQKSYVVAWHVSPPKFWGFFYSIEEARKFVEEKRKRYPMMAFTVHAEIEQS